MEVNGNVLNRWRREFREAPGNVFRGNGKQRWSEGRIPELERKIGQQGLDSGDRLTYGKLQFYLGNTLRFSKVNGESSASYLEKAERRMLKAHEVFIDL